MKTNIDKYIKKLELRLFKLQDVEAKNKLKKTLYNFLKQKYIYDKEKKYLKELGQWYIKNILKERMKS